MGTTDLRKGRNIKYYWLTREQVICIENEVYGYGSSMAGEIRLLGLRKDTILSAFRRAHDDKRTMIQSEIYKLLLNRFPNMGECEFAQQKGSRAGRKGKLSLK